MGLNRNINDDSTLAYLFNKTRQGASDALQKAIDAINATIASIQTALNNKVSKTGNETVAGVKTFSDSPKFNADVIIKSSDRYKDIILRQNDSTNGNSGMIRIDAGDATNQTNNRFLFLEYSPQTTAATAHTGFYEVYRLPEPTKGLGASATYEILTSKSPVTIAQGGTGATTAANALTNLGAVNKAGDTMTGNLLLQNNSSNVTARIYGYEAEVGTAVNKQTGAVSFLDKNGVAVGQIYGGVNGSGNPYLSIYCRRTVNGSTVYNNLQLIVDANGNATVAMNFPKAWRSALGLGTSGALPITIAQGGTGQTEVTSVTTASSIVTAASGFSIENARYTQWGKVAMFTIAFKKTTAQPTVTTMTAGTLVSGKRPAYYAPAVALNSSINWSDVYSDGSVRLSGTWAANGIIYVHAIYILA